MQTIKSYPTITEDLDSLLNPYASIGARRFVHQHYTQGKALYIHNEIRNRTDTLNEKDAATLIYTIWGKYEHADFPQCFTIDSEYTLTWQTL